MGLKQEDQEDPPADQAQADLLPEATLFQEYTDLVLLDMSTDATKYIELH